MKILIAEDNPTTRRLLEKILIKWDYEVIAVKDGAQAFDILQDDSSPRLAVLDWNMPKMDGVELCRRLRESEKEPYVYTVLLTARDQKGDLVEAMDAGADDYLTKPFDNQELRARLRAGRRIIELQEELIRTREALRIQASRDSLTTLWNHSSILEKVKLEMERSDRQNIPLGIAMIDIDHFKQVNDTYGHLAGDAVLREVAQRLSTLVRTYDAVGRYGGEEFLVVAPGCDRQQIMLMAERIRKSIEIREIPCPNGSIHVTISLGVVSTARFKGYPAETLIQVADKALYEAKAEGRNLVRVGHMDDNETEYTLKDANGS